jgi:8-oxo-dGTP pyrophosphatase MutT (NUDIX family)
LPHFVSPEAVIEGDEPLPQAGVIAYRIRRGEIQVLFVTSRDTGRWIIPKGNVKPGTSPSKAAAQEASEEAGVKGIIVSSTPLGMYTYFKQLGSGEVRAAAVQVFLLQVKKQLKKWPEKGERKLAWVSAKKAVGFIEEPGVVPLLVRLLEIDPTAAASKDLAQNPS